MVSRRRLAVLSMIADYGPGDGQFEELEPSFTPADLSPALWLEADDLSTMFQSVAGTTPVETDGQVVGTWNDKSGGGFHLTATADDTTRPVYHTAGGLHWVEFDGVNDMLRRLSALGMYAAGACSVFVACRGNPAVNCTLIADGSSTNSIPLYEAFVSDVSTATTATGFVRSAEGGQLVPFTAAPIALGFNNTDRVLGRVDSGSNMQMYLDGAAPTNANYLRSGTMPVDRFALGALLRNTTQGWWLGRVYAVVIVFRVLTAQEIADLTTYLGAKAGLTL